MGIIHRLETLLEWGGMRRDITFLGISGISLVVSFLICIPSLLTPHG